MDKDVVKNSLKIALEGYKLSNDGVHGPNHWARVFQNGLLIGKQCSADLDVVKLFAIFHDCKRENDHQDPEHGLRAAKFIETIKEQLYLDDSQIQTLQYACEHHTSGQISDDPTIGTCWDADRLDIGRMGMPLDKKYLSTNIKENDKLIDVMFKQGQEEIKLDMD